MPGPATPPSLTALAASSRVARLASLDESGRPHLVPVCYATDGRAYYSAIDAKPKRTPPTQLRRVRNIRANPQVALLIDHYSEDWAALRFVMIQGRAELLPDGPELRNAQHLLTAKYPQYTTLPLEASGLMIKITPERVVAWSATP